MPTKRETSKYRWIYVDWEPTRRLGIKENMLGLEKAGKKLQHFKVWECSSF